MQIFWSYSCHRRFLSDLLYLFSFVGSSVNFKLCGNNSRQTITMHDAIFSLSVPVCHYSLKERKLQSAHRIIIWIILVIRWAVCDNWDHKYREQDMMSLHKQLSDNRIQLIRVTANSPIPQKWSHHGLFTWDQFAFGGLSRPQKQLSFSFLLFLSVEYLNEQSLFGVCLKGSRGTLPPAANISFSSGDGRMYNKLIHHFKSLLSRQI